MKPIPLQTRIGLELSRINRSIRTHFHELNYLFWECTLRCGLDCLHCGSDCQQSAVTPDMPLEDFLRVVDSVAKVQNPNTTMIAITGGEPLMRSDLEQCGQALYNRGFPWGIVTNGWLFDKTRFDSLIDSGLRSVTISVDGLKETHDWFRSKEGSFDRAINAISLCAGSPDLQFDVVTCVSKRTVHELPKMRELFISLGLKAWRIVTIFPKGRAKDNKELLISPEELTAVMNFIAENRSSSQISISFGCEGFLGAYEGKVRDHFFSCGAGIRIGSVLADGNISACPSLRGDFIQGNIYKDDFVECWNNRFKNMRNRSWAKTGICKDCKEFRWCQGNALHLREGTDSEVLFCHYQKLNSATGEIPVLK